MWNRGFFWDNLKNGVLEKLMQVGKKEEIKASSKERDINILFFWVIKRKCVDPLQVFKYLTSGEFFFFLLNLYATI